MTSNDRYAKIREALEMEPTPGPWSLSEKYHSVNVRAVDGPYVADCNASAAIGWETKQANAHLIAACAPDTIRELLAARDALAAENERLKEEMEYLTLKFETALAEVRRRARNIWGACSSDQIIDKDVERQAKLMLEYIDAACACLEKGNSDGE